MRPLTVAAALLAVLAATAAAAPAPPRLKPFAGCPALAAYARAHGSALAVGAARAGVQPAPAAAADGGGGAVDHSTTNVQEAGVDEPDLVKSDGARILAIAQGRLRYVDVSGARPRLRGSLALDGATPFALLVDGDRALVFANGSGVIGPLPRQPSIMPIAQPGTILAEVDIGNPDALRLVQTLAVDGAFLDARLVGSSARVVLHSSPFLPLRGGTPAFVPRYALRDARSGRTTRASLVQCRNVRYPTRFSGLGLTTVLTIDLAKGLQPVDSDAVMTDSQVVYATPEHLYLATQTWLDPRLVSPTREAPATTTALHELDISDPDRTEYRASGEVPGFLLDQWSLSESGGALRVASTSTPLWWPDGARRESESQVTVLEQRAGRLVQVGQVGGLGRGEQIVGVRFVGDVGYVVTFRRVDPLHTIDLSDPAHPALAGKLDVLGYSAYLHPVGDGRLLAVGQDATDRGATLGTQVSLFDVSDPARPVRLDHLTLAGGSSEAEFDHHAFLWWPKTRLAVLPLQAPAEPFAGAIAVRADAAGRLTLAGKVSHDAQPIRRALVVGSTLYTLSDTGLAASDLATLAEEAWVPFPGS